MKIVKPALTDVEIRGAVSMVRRIADAQATAAFEVREKVKDRNKQIMQGQDELFMVWTKLMDACLVRGRLWACHMAREA